LTDLLDPGNARIVLETTVVINVIIVLLDFMERHVIMNAVCLASCMVIVIVDITVPDAYFAIQATA